jgi:transglutaminase-like putative cysteine protease/tetratricopeptide (TPR) repeat protein
VIRARVITLDGREHLLDQNLLRDAATRSADQVYDDSQLIEGPLPAVAVGAVIEEQVTLRDEKPFFAAGTVYREYVGRPVPVMHTRIVIDAPESLPLKRQARLLPNADVRETRANGRVRWVLDQGAIREQEAMESNLPPELPGWASVEFSTAESWEAVASHYRELTEPRIRKDDARPLISGLRAPANGQPSREHIAKVLERLHRQVRYTGVEFGEARLIPEYPAETLRRRFGDCKDKSTLLVAALRASGIDAYLALLSAGNGPDVAAELPGLGMFDHAIVFIPARNAGEEDLWIDATTEYARVGTLPAADANRLALVIRPGENRLIRTPTLRAADNRQIETREFHLSEYGASRVVETTETHGTVELEYRGWYAGEDSRERLDSLQQYAENTYRARGVTSYTHTGSTDFSQPYRMKLEIADAPVGSTDLHSAAVGVNLGSIAVRLPTYFTEQLEDGASQKIRQHDVVFEPYTIEWRYRIHLPDGFRVRELPANTQQSMGPAKLTAEFARGADGIVAATWRFDTVKDRYTPAEAAAFIKAVRELRARDVQLLTFDHEGAALRTEGNYKASLKAYRQLVARHPKQAVHRLRHAYALLDAGLGTRAQLEARRATELEPKYAFAWKVLGWTLQHDAVGRRFGTGFDRESAIAAYRKARALDPENTDIAADLGVLYEHDARGERYADKAGLALAVVEYRARAKLMGETQQSDRYTDNLYYSLLYLRRFAEARDLLKKESPTTARRALTLAAIAGADGSAKAVDAARELVSESERRNVLKSAGGILTNLREYAAAADLIEASTRGLGATASDAQRVALLRKTVSAQREAVKADDPRGVVLKAYSLLLANESRPEEFAALSSRHASAVSDPTGQFDRLRRAVVASLSRQDAPAEVSADLLFTNLRVTAEGNDAQGYRTQLRAFGASTHYYVVHEDGVYRLLSQGSFTGPLAAAALERLEAGDLAGARQWLDWARMEQSPANSEDPLFGFTFSRAWAAGGNDDATRIRAAAALLLADSRLPQRALPLLDAARAEARDDALRLNIDLALAGVYQQLRQWPQLEQVAGRLITASPDSGIAFHFQQWARIQQRRWDEVAAAAQGRLAQHPNDVSARRVLVQAADARGAVSELAPLMLPIIEGPRATAGDYNEFAWLSLLQSPVPERAAEFARQAYDETEGGDAAITHTLACVYAATGRPREARDLLLKILSRDGGQAPDDSAWFGFGLIAEAYGDVESARDYYARITKPDRPVLPATSLYSMSRARLASL